MKYNGREATGRILPAIQGAPASKTWTCQLPQVTRSRQLDLVGSTSAEELLRVDRASTMLEHLRAAKLCARPT